MKRNCHLKPQLFTHQISVAISEFPISMSRQSTFFKGNAYLQEQDADIESPGDARSERYQ
jgi:hypothetical protein